MRRSMLMAVYNPIEFDGRVKRTCEGLADAFDVTLLCPKGPGEYATGRFKIDRIELSAGSGRVRRLLTFWWNIVRAAVRLRPQIVYVHDLFLPFPGWVAARLSGARLIFDAHELFVPMKNAPLPRKEWLFYCLERFVVPRTDLIIAANPERAAVMQQHYRLSSMPTVVRNIPPLPVRQLTDEQVLDRYPELKKEHPEDIHVVYMGDIDLRRGLSVLLECAALLPARFKLVFVGAGPDLARVRDLASKSIHRRLRVVGSVPHVLVFDVIRQTDVGFVSYPMSGINNVLCASNKVFEYAQAGLPMVSTCQPTIKALFDEHPVGRLVGCDGELTSGGVADAIVDLAGRKEYYRENLRRLVASKTWEKEAERLLHAVEEVR